LFEGILISELVERGYALMLDDIFVGFSQANKELFARETILSRSLSTPGRN
jgi:hypothetical protein